MGHELTHVKNYDTRLMSIVTVLVGVVTLLADWLLRSTRFMGRSRGRGKEGAAAIFLLVGLFFALLSPIVSKLIQLAINRRREFSADAGSVMLTRQPSGLISALNKLSSDREPLEAANKATAHLYIVNPLGNRHDTIGWFSSLFNTHPPITDRIQALSHMV
jgi:heat shock protein HtpX